MTTKFNTTAEPTRPTGPAPSDGVSKKALITEICIALCAHAQSQEIFLAQAA